MQSLLVFCALLFVSVYCIPSEPQDEAYVLTPYGYRLKQCVMEVPSGSFVGPDPTTGKLRVESPSLDASSPSVKLLDVPVECSDDIANIYSRMVLDRRMSPKKAFDGTNPFPINGWLDYVGWYPPSGENRLEEFTSTYTIPNDPATHTPQTLFYFIGMQDNDDPSLLNIIQPVLTWGNGNPSWYVQSWACCPSNITVSSPALTGLKQGEKMNGLIKRASASTWTIDSEWAGKHTTLHAQVGDMNYNWADVTLEVYNVNNCNQFARGVFTAATLALYDNKARISPSWSFTAPTACNGHIEGSASTITIRHS